MSAAVQPKGRRPQQFPPEIIVPERKDQGAEELESRRAVTCAVDGAQHERYDLVAEPL